MTPLSFIYPAVHVSAPSSAGRHRIALSRLLACCLTLWCLDGGLFGGRSALAEPADPPPPAACLTAATAIGVARTLDLDTTAGPQLGGGPPAAADLLADGEVVLTFEDGPVRPHTAAVLDVLDAHCTKATFFLIGRQARAEPDLVREIARRGHTVGTHTYSHGDARQLGSGRAKADAELGFSAVSHALGRPAAPVFRFPTFGVPDTAAAYIRSRQVAIVAADIAPDETRVRTPEAVQRAVLSQLTTRRKGILLLRDTGSATARALDTLLTALKARGHRIVHLAPQTGLVTLAEFDTLAEKDAAGTAPANPLALRFAWPDDPATAIPPRAARGTVAPGLAAPGLAAPSPAAAPSATAATSTGALPAASGSPNATAAPKPRGANLSPGPAKPPPPDANWAAGFYQSLVETLNGPQPPPAAAPKPKPPRPPKPPANP